jgi:sugar phosphate isomerase/epimerase
MSCGYHNHTGEFKKEGDTTYWDLFAQRTTKDVVLQQDCGWSAAAGYNPVDLIKRYPGRTLITHFKPTVIPPKEGRKAYFGQDGIDWPAIYAACSEFGATQWVTIEQEAYEAGKTPMECTEISFKALKQIMADLGVK